MYPKVYTLVFAAILLCIVPVTAQSATPTTAKPDALGKGWTLSQQSRIQGLVQVTFAERGFKASLQSGITVVASAPFTELCVYSLHTKKMHRMPIDKFRAQFSKVLAIATGETLPEMHMRKYSSSQMFGFPVVKYKNTAADLAMRIAKQRDQTISRAAAKTGEATIAVGMSDVPQIHALMAKIYGIPLLNGVPLEFTFHDLDYDKKVQLSTNSAKSISVSASEFTVPPKLKLVKQQEEVSVGDSDDDAMQLILNGADRTILRK
jgi:hypothetical protein